MERELAKLYPKLAEKVDEMIPLDWNNLYFFASVLVNEDGRVCSPVFYFEDEKGRIWRSPDFCDIFNYPKEQFESDIQEVRNTVFEINDCFVKHDLEAWRGIAWKLDEDSAFEVDFLYDEIYIGKSYEELAWAHEYFGYCPKNVNARKQIQEYLIDKKKSSKQRDV